MGQSQIEAFFRTQFCFELERRSVMRGSNFHTSVSNKWAETTIGERIYDIIEFQFEKIFDDEFKLLTITAKLPALKDLRVETIWLTLDIQTRGWVDSTRTAESLNHLMSELADTVCEIYKEKERGLGAEFNYNNNCSFGRSR